MELEVGLEVAVEVELDVGLEVAVEVELDVGLEVAVEVELDVGLEVAVDVAVEVDVAPIAPRSCALAVGTETDMAAANASASASASPAITAIRPPLSNPLVASLMYPLPCRFSAPHYPTAPRRVARCIWAPLSPGASYPNRNLLEAPLRIVSSPTFFILDRAAHTLTARTVVGTLCLRAVTIAGMKPSCTPLCEVPRISLLRGSVNKGSWKAGFEHRFPEPSA